MVIAFQVVLLIVILVSLLGVIGERKDFSLRIQLTIICIMTILAFLVSVMWL